MSIADKAMFKVIFSGQKRMEKEWERMGIKDSNGNSRHITEQPKPNPEMDSGFSRTPWIFAIAVLIGFIFAFTRRKKR